MRKPLAVKTPGEPHAQVDVAWIPSEFAKKKKILKVKKGDVWVDGWEVVEVGSTKEAEFVEKHARDFRDFEWVLDS